METQNYALEALPDLLSRHELGLLYAVLNQATDAADAQDTLRPVDDNETEGERLARRIRLLARGR